MQGIKKIIIAITGATLGALAFPSSAIMSVPCGWYVEGNFGASHSSTTYPGTSAVSTGTAWNVNGGYKFFPMMGVEVGANSYSFSSLKNQATDVQYGIDKHWGYDLAIKGMLPVANTGLEIFGKAGGIQLYSSINGQNNEPIPAGVALRKTSHLSAYYGAGLAYYFTNSWAVNAQWARANGNSSTGKQDLFTGGLTWIVF